MISFIQTLSSTTANQFLPQFEVLLWGILGARHADTMTKYQESCRVRVLRTGQIRTCACSDPTPTSGLHRPRALRAIQLVLHQLV